MKVYPNNHGLAPVRNAILKIYCPLTELGNIAYGKIAKVYTAPPIDSMLFEISIPMDQIKWVERDDGPESWKDRGFQIKFK